MNADEIRTRTGRLRCASSGWPKAYSQTPTANVIRNQMLRCGSSVGANYRAACRAKSKPDFVSKMGIVEEEADETIYWMELVN